jgi:hypothetical protein
LKQLRTQGASPDEIAEAQRAVAEAKSALNTLDDEFSQAKTAFGEFVQKEFKGTRIQLPPDETGRVETVILDDPLGTGRFGLVARSQERPAEVVKVLVNRRLAIERQEEEVIRILTRDLNANRTPTPQQVRLLRRYMLEPDTLPLAGPVDDALRELGIEPSRARLLPREIEKIKAEASSGADLELKTAFEGQKQGAAYLDKVNAELVKAGKEPIAYKRILSSGSDGDIHFLKLELVQTELKIGPGGRYAERFVAGPLTEADQTAIALVQKQLADVRGAWADPNTGNVMLIDQYDRIDQTGQTLRRGGIIDTDRMGGINSPEIVSWRQSYARAPHAYNINSLRNPRAVTDPAERLRIIEENATILSDPHRFALKQFEASGYIEFVPGKGYEQLLMDPRTIERVFDVDLNDPRLTPPDLLRSSFELKLAPARAVARPLWMKGWREAA